MNNQENKNVNQKRLFELIQKGIPANASLAKEIADAIDIGIDAAYRRIRGDKPLSLEEAITLCNYFGISFEKQLAHQEDMKFSFVPPNLEDIRSYVMYAQELARITDKVNLLPGCEIILSAADIPTYHFSGYSEMTIFQSFSWHKNMYDYPGTFEDFNNDFNTQGIMDYCSKVYANYLQIPSKEIWTENTIDSMIKQITYHVEMEHFKDRKVPLLITDQLVELFESLHEWIKNGEKGKEKTPFKFYLNDIDIGNTLIFFNNEQQRRCIIRLFTINGINIIDERFCFEVSHWLERLIKRSMLISGIATIERPRFISAQKQKILALKGFIESF